MEKAETDKKTNKQKNLYALGTIGKQFGGIRGVSPGDEKEGYDGKDLQKRKVLSLE